MVKSRWNTPNCALSRAMLLTNLAPDLDTLEDFKLLRQEGLDIHSFLQEDAKALLASWMYHKPLRSPFA
ncbi:hypothetical protein B0H12DRAFT_1146937 [Mycena haematopus]|nr:hypothetical protein B0H12DRAFT_1146937 [Mycena haematopus]